MLFARNQKTHDKLVGETMDGWTLVGYGSRKDWRTYRHDACGRHQDAQTGHMRKGNVRCRACQHDKLVSETPPGWTLVGPGSNANYRTYRHDACGRHQDAQTGSMRSGKVRCQACLHDKLVAETPPGWTLVGPGRSKIWRTYQHHCGHQQEVATSNMRNGVVRCQACLQAKILSEVQPGWTLVGQGRGCHWRTYQHHCGHQQEVATGNMRNGAVACRGCSDSYVSKPAWVYLIRIEPPGWNQFLKVGIAKSPDARFGSYGVPKDCISAVHTVKLPTRDAAEALEEAVLQAVKPWAMDYTPLANGSTECFRIGGLYEALGVMHATA